MITVTAIQTVKPGKEDQLITLMRELTLQVRKEPGCVSFDYVQSSSSKDSYLVIEKYTGEEALTFHQHTSYLQAFIPKMMECLTGPPLVVVYQDVFTDL